jgi:cytochrome oxidase Cu insertion factor (SCO1/SenC/PrrC family)
MNKTIRLFTGLMFVVAGLTVVALTRKSARDADAAKIDEQAQTLSAADWTPGDPIEHFTLTQQTKQPFNSKSLAGKVWVANFFFASCPANCRKQSSRVAELAREFGHEGVKFLSITVDPDNDSPEVLAAYGRSFNADPDDWKFLTGDLTYITYIGREVFDVAVMPKGHTEKLILVDQNGVVRGYYSWSDPVDVVKMKTTIRGLLDGSIPPAEKKAKPAPSEEAKKPESELEEEDAGSNATLESPRYEPEGPAN